MCPPFDDHLGEVDELTGDRLDFVGRRLDHAGLLVCFELGRDAGSLGRGATDAAFAASLN